jgi:uncharacterized protein
MSELSISLLLAVAFTFFFAGTVKGVTGMGLPTVAMGVLGSLLSPLAAATMLIIPSFVTNVWQLLAGPSFAGVIRRLGTMMVAIVIGTVAGASMLTGGDTRLTTAALGIALMAYAVYTLVAKPYHVNPAYEGWLSPLIGLITGLVTGATGVFVIPAVPYIQALGFEKDDLVQALGLSFTVSTIALAIGLASRGAYQPDGMAISALAVIPALIGMWAGQKVRQAVSPATFKRWFLIALAVLGTEMMLRGFW